VTYENLSTEDSDVLLIDAVGNPEGPWINGKRARAKLHLRLLTPRLPDPESEDIRSKKGEFAWYDWVLGREEEKLIEIGSLVYINRTGLPYHNVICYELRGADPISTPQITLLYFANHASCLGKNAQDAVGFALPADLLIGSVSVRVTFHEGLRPEPEASSRPFLIRRYAIAARPNQFSSQDVPLPTEKTDPERNTVTYNFELARPKPGYGYVISWKGLDWQPRGKVQLRENLTKVYEEDWNKHQYVD
jgi:hypothetical protein